jgi:hypothetical protein
MSDKAMHMNSKERKELAISEIVLIILGVIGLAVVLWLAWFRPTVRSVNSYESCAAAGNAIQDSYPSVCVTKDGKRFLNPKEKVDTTIPNAAEQQSQQTQSAPAAQPKYLAITEWGVRVKLSDELSDMKYAYAKSDDGERTTFTFGRLTALGICQNDVGVAMTRLTTENDPPFSIDNPEPIAHVGGYYYYIAYGGSPCYDSSDTEQMKVVNTINNGNVLGAVKQSLQKLEAVQ